MTILDKEKVITFLIDKFNDSKNNEISISENDLDNIDLTEQEIIQCLYLLQSDNFLIIKAKSIHDDFSRFWTIELNSCCIFYFENKKIDKKDKRRAIFFEIRAWITLLIAILGFILSVYTVFYEKPVSSYTGEHDGNYYQYNDPIVP